LLFRYDSIGDNIQSSEKHLQTLLSQNHSLQRNLDDINEWQKTVDRKLSIAQPLPLEIAKLTELVSSII
jgi:hypothetical protein